MRISNSRFEITFPAARHLDFTRVEVRQLRASAPPREKAVCRRGFTLVEVLLASLILGIGLTVLLSSLSTCLRTMRLARDYDQVQWVLGLGELTYPEPMEPSKDVQTDYTVDPDSHLCEGFAFERTVDKKTPEAEEKDKLFVVRTRVRWGGNDSSDQASEELVRYVWERKK